MAAEVAADRASDDDVQSLVEIDARADLTTPAAPAALVGRFQLEVAADQPVARLVHEELRLQAETGVLLWLCLRQQEYRDRSREARLEVIDAIRRADAASARRATVEHITSAVEWLVDEKARLEAASVTDAATTRPRSTEGEPAMTLVDTAMGIAERVAATIDPVFAVIDDWRARSSACSPTTRSRAPPRSTPSSPSSSRVSSSAPGTLITGAGFVAAPGFLADAPWHLAWWLSGASPFRVEQTGGGLRRLDAVSDPDAEAFRD